MAAAPTQAQRVAAVLSSDLRPYREAYAGFVSALGEASIVSTLGEGDLRIPQEALVVVTFGSKAALRKYPEGLSRVLCMAPAAQAHGDAEQGLRHVRVHMLPDAEWVLSRIHDLQPGLRRLATLSVLAVPIGYLDSLHAAAFARGIELHNEHLPAVVELPRRLRQLARLGIDALWLPPDPLLINAGTFAILNEFSRANGVPLYVPTVGLVEAGAVACVAPSFEQIGVAAAVAIRDLLAGGPGPVEVFPVNSETTVNTAAARRVGLSEEVVRRVADRLVETAE